MQIPFAPRLRQRLTHMESVDRLGWACGLSVVSCGARLGIRVNEPSILPRLIPHLPPGQRPSRCPQVDTLYSLWVGRGGSHQLYEGAERIVESSDLDEVLRHLESCLHFSTALGAPRKLFVHAGVVSWQGRAIVIPGRSRAGKTSLVVALVRAGAAYCSDEYAVFDSRGRVYPYPKPLSIRGANGEPARSCAVEALGGHAETRPLPIGLVVVTVYSPGASWRARALSPGKATLALFDNTVLARSRSELALTALGRAAEHALAFEGERGEAEEIARWLLRCLSENPGAPAGAVCPRREATYEIRSATAAGGRERGTS